MSEKHHWLYKFYAGCFFVFLSSKFCIYSKNVEIDFCIPSKKMAIQVAYDLIDDDTYDREVGGLLRFLSAFSEYSGIIITMDDERTINVEGRIIEVVPVWKWLLLTEHYKDHKAEFE